MMFSLTPIVVHERSPFVESTSTRVIAPVPARTGRRACPRSPRPPRPRLRRARAGISAGRRGLDSRACRRSRRSVRGGRAAIPRVRCRGDRRGDPHASRGQAAGPGPAAGSVAGEADRRAPTARTDRWAYDETIAASTSLMRLRAPALDHTGDAAGTSGPPRRARIGLRAATRPLGGGRSGSSRGAPATRPR